MDLVKGMVLGENRSYMTDTHFAELEGIREESTLLLRNFYKVMVTITVLHTTVGPLNVYKKSEGQITM